MVVIKFVVPSNKTTSGVEVWRCTARDMEKDYDVDKLKSKLRNYHHDSDAQFLLSWFDGTDECSIVSNGDLMELLEYSRETNPNCNEVRINVKLIHPDDNIETSNQNSSDDRHPEEVSKSSEEFELLNEVVLENKIIEKELDETNQPRQHQNSETEHEAPNHHTSLPNQANTVEHASGIPTQLPSQNQVPLICTTMPWDSPDKMAAQMQNPMMAQYPMGQMYYPPPTCGQWAQYPYFMPTFMPPTPIIQEADPQQTPQQQSAISTTTEAAAKSTTLTSVPSASSAQSSDFPVSSDEPTSNRKSAADAKPASNSPNLTPQGATKKGLRKDHSRPSQDNTGENVTARKASDRDAVNKIIDQVKLMGFPQDEKSIKKLAAKYNGDINKILDKLSR